MLDNPFDNLTDEEIKEMVEFCREYFQPKHEYVGDCELNSGGLGRTIQTTTSWDWKKGDWYWQENPRGRDDSIGLVDEHIILYFDHIEDEPQPIPLPLIHQWMELLPEYYFLIRADNGKWKCGTANQCTWTFHDNIHYVGCLTFKKKGNLK